ncbi:MAG: PQQ-dependent sugar dehydrogenase, partial [Bacteroidota bacterium]
MKKLLPPALFFYILLPQLLFSQITLTPYCTGFTAPSDIRNCGDGRLFIVEQPGRIRIIDSNGVLQATPFLDISSRVLYGGERGLLGLAFPADYQDSGYFYVNYTGRTQPGTGPTTISRFRVSATNPNIADPTSEEILLVIYQPYSNHNGGCLAFNPLNGYLYIGTGDGGSQGDPGNRAQNPDSLLGKMLRLQVTSGTPGYSIPPTNPFAGNPSQGRAEVWSIGMRNPWRFSFDPYTADLWIGDVGQNAWEEVDLESGGTSGGKNYGWRCYEGNHTYNSSGCAAPSTFTPAFYEYAHSGGNCSVTGGYIYRGGKYADMYGKYFFTDYCVNQMRTLVKTGSTYSFANLGVLATGSYVAFGTDKWGELYAADAVNGRIMKFTGTNCNPIAAINGGISDTIQICGCADV